MAVPAVPVATALYYEPLSRFMIGYSYGPHKMAHLAVHNHMHAVV